MLDWLKTKEEEQTYRAELPTHGSSHFRLREKERFSTDCLMVADGGRLPSNALRRTHLSRDLHLQRAAAGGQGCCCVCPLSRWDAARRRRGPITMRPPRSAQRPVICSKLSREKNTSWPCDWRGGWRERTWAAAEAVPPKIHHALSKPARRQILVDSLQTRQVCVTGRASKMSSSHVCTEIKTGAPDSDRNRQQLMYICNIP